MGRFSNSRATGASASKSAAVLLVLWVVAVAAGQVGVDLQVSTYQAQVDEPIIAQLRIDNYQNYDAPVFPDINGCTVEFSSGPNVSSSIYYDSRVGKVERRSVDFRWEITAHTPGEIEIPSFFVSVDGKILPTRALRIQVNQADDSPLIAEILCDENRLFVGQEVQFTLRVWLLPAQLNGQPLDPSQMYQILDSRREGIGPFAAATSVATRRREAPAGKSAEYYVYDLSARIVIDRPGVPEFDSTVLRVNYPLRLVRTAFGIDMRSSRRLRVVPEVHAPEAEPLPTEGRPRGFSGAVGRFEIDAVTRDTNVRVGDPIQLSIEISGVGPLDSLPPPDLAAQAALTEGFRVPSEKLAGTVRGNRRVFTQTIRAKRADVTEIPSIEFPYFDPDSARYEVARSAPIPIRVGVVEALDVASLPDAGAPEADGDAVAPLDGLRGNRTSESELLAVVPPVTATELLAAAAAPPLVFVMTWAFVALRSAGAGSEAQRRRRRALPVALDRIRTASADATAREIEAALAGYLADRLNAPPARFTGRTALDFAGARVTPELVGEYQQLVDACESASYGGGAAPEDLRARAEAVLQQLEAQRL